MVEEIQNENKNNTKLYQQIRNQTKRKNTTVKASTNKWKDYMANITKVEEEEYEKSHRIINNWKNQ